MQKNSLIRKIRLVSNFMMSEREKQTNAISQEVKASENKL